MPKRKAASPEPSASKKKSETHAAPQPGRMGSADFARIRGLLGRSQRELADVLGLSVKAVESYEQGWRRVPAAVERILYFLLFKVNEESLRDEAPCWEATACPDARRENCVAWLAKEGRYCWFFTGRLCSQAESGHADSCYACGVFASLFERVRTELVAGPPKAPPEATPKATPQARPRGPAATSKGRATCR